MKYYNTERNNIKLKGLSSILNSVFT
ncbi:hypothetical protein CYG68_20020 [Morganella morganii]|uniref:Uncharacterized protein n=1 Tax=Morganella morganii TaxID=582 RepID=A0A8I0U8R8_MORMO|nr:hypothetical protein [Morganella morganii]